jgi:hypothetical protein
VAVPGRVRLLALFVLAGCPDIGLKTTITTPDTGGCFQSSDSFDVLCAMQIGATIETEIESGDVTIVTSSLLMNTYHVGVGFTGYISSQNIDKTGPECGMFDPRINGTTCPLLHDGVSCVGPQTAIGIFDGGPTGKQIANFEINVPMTCP